MNRRTITLFVLIAALSMLLAVPASAFTKLTTCNGHWTRWQNPSRTLNVSTHVSQFWTGAWSGSLGNAAAGWNNAPGNNFRIYYDWTLAVPPAVSGDGEDDLVIAPNNWGYPGYAAVTKHRTSDCDTWNPYDVSHYTEVDILLNPDTETSVWDKSGSPVPSDNMKNTTLLVHHTFGHLMGLGHEDSLLATMNSGSSGHWGGPVGNNNRVQALPDDARGARNAYGTSGTVRDVAASAIRLVSTGVSKTIPAPGWTFRNAYLSFPFTILNRGTTDQSIPVHFYLSPTRWAAPGYGFYLGSATISLQYGRVSTGTAYLLIPSNAPSGYQYLGWYTDPYNGIAEGDEDNNGVALVSPTYISDDRAPNACFTANPTSGYVPLTVSFNASCTSDPDGDALTYSWDFGDGTTDSGQSVSHTYYYAGNFVATLTVTDPYGATSTAYQSISVACSGSRFCPEEPL